VLELRFFPTTFLRTFTAKLTGVTLGQEEKLVKGYFFFELAIKRGMQ